MEVTDVTKIGVTLSGGGVRGLVHLGRPGLDPALVHNIIKAAGVHIYTSDREDIVYACASYLALFTRQDGARTVWLPSPRQVCERFHGVVDGEAPLHEITWDAESYTTHLFEMP
jgi:hypothetical protein